MFGRSLPAFRILGIPIRVDLSWLLVAALIAWSLSRFFAATTPGLAPVAYAWMGLAGALGLFGAVIVHELAHSVIARGYGLSIRGVTLFVFGGVAEIEGEPPNPAAEFAVAIAGPIASLAVAVAALGVWTGGTRAGWPAAVNAVTGYLAAVNGLLLAFNLIPAFPLDGGRVLRSLLWQALGSLRKATLTCARIGAGFGFVLIAGGAWRLLAAGDVVGGIWGVFLGLFLRQAGRLSYRQVVVRGALAGQPVARFLSGEAVAVSRSMSVAELVEQYVYRHRQPLFPVVDDGRLLGCVTTRRVRELPRDEWARQSVGTLVEPCSDENSLASGSDAAAALALFSRTGTSHLMVVEDDRLVGVLALQDLLRFLSLETQLAGRRG